MSDFGEVDKKNISGTISKCAKIGEIICRSANPTKSLLQDLQLFSDDLRHLSRHLVVCAAAAMGKGRKKTPRDVGKAW